MTCRIDRSWTEQGVVLQISGRIAAEDLEVVCTALNGRRVVAIDLAEVELVDREAVNLLARTEAEGIELRNCPAYIREWITKERESSQRTGGRRWVAFMWRSELLKETVMAKLADVVEATAIRPFQVNIPETDLTELRRRIRATRFPEKETVTDSSQGVQLAFMQEVARYWATDYDWRKVEAKLNSYPQFITEIDGLDIHFLHVRSRHDGAMPLIVTHGWPGSPIEQLKIIDPLTNPTAHGASALDAFHVVIPSMAGYGFSGKPTTPGWDPARMARAWVEVMKRLGYSRFAAQGGDWGGFVTNAMALQAPPELIGIHVNFAGTAPSDVARALPGPPPAGLSGEERRAYDQMAFLYSHIPTQIMMASHPQTLYGLADSPVALAAWMIDHDVTSYGHIAKLFLDGEPYGDLTRDDILDNITLSWLTNTGVSCARLYQEYKGGFFNDFNISVPAAVSVFPEEVYQAPRSWTERAYKNLVHFNEVAKGGHFAAWEQPQLFSEEVRAGFRSLRE